MEIASAKHRSVSSHYIEPKSRVSLISSFSREKEDDKEGAAAAGQGFSASFGGQSQTEDIQIKGSKMKRNSMQ